MHKYQIAFNDAVAGVVKQGDFGYDSVTGCMYRTPEGLKCAIGHLIPDDKYDENFEKVGLTAVIASGALEPYGLGAEDAPFLTELQASHDMARDIQDFIVLANEVGQEFGLEAWKPKGDA